MSRSADQTGRRWAMAAGMVPSRGCRGRMRAGNPRLMTRLAWHPKSLPGSPAFRARDRRERRGDPGILEVAVRPERMAVGEDVTGGALPRRDAHRAVAFVLRARPVAELDAVGARITQRDERHVALAHPAGALGDSLEHRRQIERRVDGAYHRRQ